MVISTLNEVYRKSDEAVIDKGQLYECGQRFADLKIEYTFELEYILKHTADSHLNKCLYEEFEGFYLWHYIHNPSLKDALRDPEYDIIYFRLSDHFPDTLHIHEEADGRFLILEGEGAVLLQGGRELEVGPGMYFDVPRGVPHEFYARKLTALGINHQPIYKKSGKPDFVWVI